MIVFVRGKLRSLSPRAFRREQQGRAKWNGTSRTVWGSCANRADGRVAMAKVNESFMMEFRAINCAFLGAWYSIFWYRCRTEVK